jgi:uncharacterized protein
MLILILIVFMIISWMVGNQLKRKFREFSEIPTSSGKSGAEIAANMLRDNNIHDVQITCVEGQLTDHYNPLNKTVNLSKEVYHGRNVAAAAVAAHECGHAVQHAQSYAFLQFRSAMVPVVNISSKIMNFIFLAGMFFTFGYSIFGIKEVLLIIIAAQGMITLFSLVTLPVEFDASARALAWLDASRITRGHEYDKAKIALKWAASTYLVAALAAVSTLLYYIMLFMGRRDD